jgi:predicted DCC family thiol-disulfide oxidoreductase YuxK
MISLMSDITDRKGRRARGWLFFDAECEFCTWIARWLVTPIGRHGFAVAPLQDPRVGALLGLPQNELTSAIRFLSEDGAPQSGADAILAVARQFWWGRPLLWLSRVPGVIFAMHAGYRWVAQHRRCRLGMAASASFRA